MDENLPDIDRYFKDVLEEYAEAPPEFVWEGISQSLGEKPAPSAGPGSALLSVPAWLIVLVCLLPPQKMPVNNLATLPVKDPETEKPMNTNPAMNLAVGNSLYPVSLQKESVAYMAVQGNREISRGRKEFAGNGSFEGKRTAFVQVHIPDENKPAGNTIFSKRETAENSEHYPYTLAKDNGLADARAETGIPSTYEYTKEKKAVNGSGEAEKILFSGRADTISQIITGGSKASVVPVQKNQPAFIAPVENNQPATAGYKATGRNFTENKMFAVPENNHTDLYHYSVQSLLTSGTVKKVTQTLAAPAITGRNASAGAPDAGVKPAKLPNHPGWSVSAFYRPEWQQKQMGKIENDRHDGPRNDRHAIRQQQPDITSFTTGLVAGVQLGNGIIIESGLSMFNQTSSKGRQLVRSRPDSGGAYKLRFDFAEGYTHIQLKNGNPPSATDSVTITGATSTIRYVGVPLQVSYPFKFGKFYTVPTAGITFQWLTKGTLDAQVQQGQDKHPISGNKISGLKNSFVSGQAGLSLEYRLSAALRVQMAPTYRFSVNPVNKGAAVQYYPAAWGVGLGVRWTFR